MELLEKQKYENWQVGDVFALKLEEVNKYLILTLYEAPYETSCDIRCKFRTKITNNEHLPNDKEEIDALEFIKVDFIHFYERYFPLKGSETYAECVERQLSKKFYPDEYDYLYYYLFELALLKRSRIYKELIYLGNFDIIPSIDDYTNGHEKLFFLKELKDELYKCYINYNLRKSSVYDMVNHAEIEKNSFMALNLMLNLPPMEELHKIYGPIIKKEKKKKRDSLTEVDFDD